MFSKIIVMILTAITFITGFAAEEVKKVDNKPQTPLQYIKEKVDFSYHGEFYFKHNKNDELKDFSHLNIPALTYHFAKEWKFSGSAEFKFANPPVGSYQNRFFRALYSVTRENIMTEKAQGIKLDVGVGRRVFDRIVSPDTFGNTRINATISKSIPGGIGKHSGTLFVQYLYNDPKNISADTWKHGIELLPALSLQFTEKFSFTFTDDINIFFPWDKTNPKDLSTNHEAYASWTYKYNDKISPYFQFHYLHGEDFTKAIGKKTDSLDYLIGFGYTLNKNVTISPELGSQLSSNGDKNFFSDKLKYINFTLYLDLTF